MFSFDARTPDLFHRISQAGTGVAKTEAMPRWPLAIPLALAAVSVARPAAGQPGSHLAMRGETERPLELPVPAPAPQSSPAAPDAVTGADAPIRFETRGAGDESGLFDLGAGLRPTVQLGPLTSFAHAGFVDFGREAPLHLTPGLGAGVDLILSKRASIGASAGRYLGSDGEWDSLDWYGRAALALRF